MKELIQLSLFDDGEVIKPIHKTTAKDKFYDYESYVKKINKKEWKEHILTTDDTYTPTDVYDAVVKYVSTIYDLTNKTIVRPFYPNGDYQNETYPENAVVIDNPPFSIFLKILKFYKFHKIPFFLFGNGMTILSATKFCSVVISNTKITYHNGAVVNTNFATNMLGDDVAVITAPLLHDLITNTYSQKKSQKRVRLELDDDIISVNVLNKICAKGDKEIKNFEIKMDDFERVREIGGRKAFGDHLKIKNKKIIDLKNEILK